MSDHANLGSGRSVAVIACVRGEIDPANPSAHAGAVVEQWFRDRGYEATSTVVVPVGSAVGHALDDALANTPTPRFIVTLGGTGLNPRDQTPQETLARLDFEAPGIVHSIWQRGLALMPEAVMSRGIAGVRGETFILNLPSSRGGARDGLAVLADLIHLIQAQIEDTI